MIVLGAWRRLLEKLNIDQNFKDDFWDYLGESFQKLTVNTFF